MHHTKNGPVSVREAPARPRRAENGLLYGLPAVSGEVPKSVMNLLSVLDIPFDASWPLVPAVFEDIV